MAPEVGGSNPPVHPKICLLEVWKAYCFGFFDIFTSGGESAFLKAGIAQLAEHLHGKEGVAGSNPAPGSTMDYDLFGRFFHVFTYQG